MGVIVVFLGAVLLALIASLNVAAHSFYDPACCSDRDCFPISNRHVRLVATGYAVSWNDKEYIVPDAKVRVSKDERFHLCINPGGQRLCFYAPPLGS